MNNFTYHNPVRIRFGKGAVASLAEELPADATILMVYGGGSIKKNGVYDRVMAVAKDRIAGEFGGIEPNPLYETCMKAVDAVGTAGANFLLAVGGGSVLDATKFIAAASKFDGGDPWRILSEGAEVASALPFGTILTLPATGSEMNGNSVISRRSTNEKLAFGSPRVLPVFSILDPETTYTLPPRQVTNGIVDAFVHVMEQYLTYPVGGYLQDRQAEAILLTLIDRAKAVKNDPNDYDTRAAIMWCATLALNGLIGCGVPGDWTTHAVGHELTALYGVDHAQSLAIVLPGVMRHQRDRKREKLLQYGERVWGIRATDEARRIDEAIARTEEFFRDTGCDTRLSDYGIPESAGRIVAERLEKRGVKSLGEHSAITPSHVAEILKLRA